MCPIRRRGSGKVTGCEHTQSPISACLLNEQATNNSWATHLGIPHPFLQMSRERVSGRQPEVTEHPFQGLGARKDQEVTILPTQMSHNSNEQDPSFELGNSLYREKQLPGLCSFPCQQVALSPVQTPTWLPSLHSCLRQPPTGTSPKAERSRRQAASSNKSWIRQQCTAILELVTATKAHRGRKPHLCGDAC